MPQETIIDLLNMCMVSHCSKKTDPHSKAMEKTQRLSQQTFPTKTFSMHRKSEASSHVGNVTSLVWSTPKVNSHYRKRMP